MAHEWWAHSASEGPDAASFPACGGRDQAELIVTEGLGLDTFCPTRRPGGIVLLDDEIEIAGEQGRDPVFGPDVGRLDREIGMIAVQARQRTGNDRVQSGLEGSDAHRAGHLVPSRGDLRLCGFELTEDRLGAGDEDQGLFGQADAAAHAFEQGSPDLGFQGLELVRDRGRVLSQSGRGRGQASPSADLSQEAKPFEAVHRSPIPRHSATIHE
jgi:hypothetical protein